MQSDDTQQKIVIYTAPNGEVDLRVQMQDETVWLSQKDLGELFGIDRTVVTKHLKNIFTSGELSEKSVSAKIAHTAKDSKQYLTKFYNLDAIISVGYRVDSKNATHFRIWATKTLKQHITKGYTINPHMIQKNYETFLSAVEDVKKLASGGVRPKRQRQNYLLGIVNVEGVI